MNDLGDRVSRFQISTKKSMVTDPAFLTNHFVILYVSTTQTTLNVNEECTLEKRVFNFSLTASPVKSRSRVVQPAD